MARKKISKKNVELGVDENFDGDIEFDFTGEDYDDETALEPSKLEQRKRRRSIRASKALFRAVDAITGSTTKSCPYLSKDDIAAIETIKDIVYDATLPETCTMDLYRVKTNEKQPVVFLIHGGGFSAGDKKYRKGQSQWLAINGFTVINVNYGLAPEFTFPTPVNQLIVAANYVYDNAEKLSIDRDKILIAGDSAGGYYSAMLATISTNKTFNDEFAEPLRCKFIGALLVCGLFDLDTVLSTKYILDIDDGVFLSFVGISRKEFDRFENKNICMPSKFINNKFPPSFIVYAPQDLLCKGQAETLIEKLGELDVYCEYYGARHLTSNHCFSILWSGEDACAANELMLSFAKRLVGDKIKF